MFEIVDESLQSFNYRSMFFHGLISFIRYNTIRFLSVKVIKKYYKEKEDRKQRVIVKCATIMKMIRNTWISKIRLNFSITSMQRDTISSIIL